MAKHFINYKYKYKEIHALLLRGCNNNGFTLSSANGATVLRCRPLTETAKAYRLLVLSVSAVSERNISEDERNAAGEVFWIPKAMLYIERDELKLYRTNNMTLYFPNYFLISFCKKQKNAQEE